MYGIALNVACSRSTMVGIYRLAERASQFCANVLIMGESGVGKEHLARQIHRFKDPDERGFRIYNCHSSEIDFDEIRGLFHHRTDIVAEEKPVTVFLKSLEEVQEKEQLKLLELLEEEELMGLLEGVERQRKPRLICSCQKDATGDSCQGLQQRLAYRLDVIHIEIPPLRDRREEILPLADLFLQEFKIKYGKRLIGFSPDVRETLLIYSWPGNVRELRNVIEEAVILSKGSFVDEIHIN
jgi:DNA-binding NtrC family response regulator